MESIQNLFLYHYLGHCHYDTSTLTAIPNLILPQPQPICLHILPLHFYLFFNHYLNASITIATTPSITAFTTVSIFTITTSLHQLYIFGSVSTVINTSIFITTITTVPATTLFLYLCCDLYNTIYPLLYLYFYVFGPPPLLLPLFVSTIQALDGIVYIKHIMLVQKQTYCRPCNI